MEASTAEPDNKQPIPVLIYRVARMDPDHFYTEFDGAITNLGSSDFTFMKLTPDELARIEEAEGYTCEACGVNIHPGKEKAVGEVSLCAACASKLDL